jgi:hypothetical protein
MGSGGCRWKRAPFAGSASSAFRAASSCLVRSCSGPVPLGISAAGRFDFLTYGSCHNDTDFPVVSTAAPKGSKLPFTPRAKSLRGGVAPA